MDLQLFGLQHFQDPLFDFSQRSAVPEQDMEPSSIMRLFKQTCGFGDDFSVQNNVGLRRRVAVLN